MTRSIHLEHGDCLDVMADLEPDSMGSLVCDPPYGLSAPPDIAEVLRCWLAEEAYAHGRKGFMGRTWDSFVPGPRYWRAAFRAMKPGAHGVVFAGQRTVDLMGISLRLGGFEIRDLGGWAYWSGFPKSLSLARALDDLAGHSGRSHYSGPNGLNKVYGVGMGGGFTTQPYEPATPEAKQWDGFGTAIKPAIEPWLLVRKPISESSIARNVLRWGTGGLNLDACRFRPGDSMWVGPNGGASTVRQGTAFDEASALSIGGTRNEHITCGGHPLGRFPANLIHCAKASRAERERGCEGLPAVTSAETVTREAGSAGINNPRAGAGRTGGRSVAMGGGWSNGRAAGDGSTRPGYVYAQGAIRNHHPTVKPVALMRWLARLVTPPGGVVLDPYMGSGTCGVAAALEAFSYLGIELDQWDDNDPRAKGGATYMQIARARIENATSGRWVTAPESSRTPDLRVQRGLFG